MKPEKAPRRKGWASPFIHPTALFIRDYLLRHGEGYAQEMWRELKRLRGDLHTCSYDSFRRNYVYILKKLGLIEEARIEVVPNRPEWYKRRYYRIVSGNEELSDEWMNPQKFFRLRRYGYYRHKGEKA